MKKVVTQIVFLVLVSLGLSQIIEGFIEACIDTSFLNDLIFGSILLVLAYVLAEDEVNGEM